MGTLIHKQAPLKHLIMFHCVPRIGWTQWNLSRFEFKFDDNSICPVGCLSLAFVNWHSQQGLSNVRTQQKKSIGPILFLYHEESLVSSNLNKTILVSLCRSEDQCIWTYFILSVPLIFFTGLGRVGAWKIPVSDSVVSFKHSPPPLGGPTVATSSLAPRR